MRQGVSQRQNVLANDRMEGWGDGSESGRKPNSPTGCSGDSVCRVTLLQPWQVNAMRVQGISARSQPSSPVVEALRPGIPREHARERPRPLRARMRARSEDDAQGGERAQRSLSLSRWLSPQEFGTYPSQEGGGPAGHGQSKHLKTKHKKTQQNTEVKKSRWLKINRSIKIKMPRPHFHI